MPPARARPAKVPRDDSLRGKLARTALKAVTYASRRTSEGLQRASNYLDGTATRAEGARQLLKTLKKKDALSQTTEALLAVAAADAELQRYYAA